MSLTLLSKINASMFITFFPGHSLKPLDLEFLSRIQDKVNVIPVIAKADTLTPEECREFKKTILSDLASRKIRVFEFIDPPECSGNYVSVFIFSC